MARFDDPTHRRAYPAIPSSASPQPRVLDALRECVEIALRRRGRVEDSLVSVDDLIELGLIKPEQAKLIRGKR